MIQGKYGSVTNDYGVRITKGELRRFQEAVPQANRIIGAEKRRRAKSPLKYGEFNIDLRVSDISRFRNRQSFLNYLKTTEQIARGTYFRQKAIAYRKNYIKSLEINFGSMASKLINKVKRLPIAEFRKLVESDKIQSIGFIYFETEGDMEDRVQSILDRIGKETGHGRKDGTTRTYKVKGPDYNKVRGTEGIKYIKKKSRKARF